MTHVYFVRHCQSVSPWKESDSIRPLTVRGMEDSAFVTLAMRDIPLDYCICSPYIRSINTVKSCAMDHGLQLHTDVRFGERISGPVNDEKALIMRWSDHDYHENEGESINSVQKRNIEGLHELLLSHSSENILLGTHGTALSTILDYYEPGFGLNGFTTLLNWMPYIIHAEFDGTTLLARKDLLIVNRGY